MTEVTDGPVFHVEPQGRLANRMIQYMVALTFQSLVPGCRISNVQIPEWGIDHPPLELPEPIERATQPQHIEMAGLTERARTCQVRSIVYNGYGQRMENFLDVDVCRAAFRAPVVSPMRFDERYLVCHVRADEMLVGGPDPNYPLTPIEFYADIVAETGLIPVFLGQTGPSLYMDRLRARFPRAVILDTRDIVLDFQTIREAKNIAFGCGSYGWLAAWLSHADRIFMAVTGLLNPMQYHLVDLLPFGDPRYRFYLFPINYSVPLEHHAAAHRRIAPLWRFVPQDIVAAPVPGGTALRSAGREMLEVFDAEYYLDDQWRRRDHVSVPAMWRARGSITGSTGCASGACHSGCRRPGMPRIIRPRPSKLPRATTAVSPIITSRWAATTVIGRCRMLAT